MASSKVENLRFKNGNFSRTEGAFGVWNPTASDVLYHTFEESGLYLINLGFIINIGDDVQTDVTVWLKNCPSDAVSSDSGYTLKTVQFEGKGVRAPLALTYLGRIEAGRKLMVHVAPDNGRTDNIRLLPILENEQNVYWIKLTD